MITYEHQKDGTLKQVDSPPKRAELVEQRIYDRCLVRVGQLEAEKATLEARIDELCAENERLKEREQSLVTLLRNDCDIEASWDGVRKFWYIGLTENGCLMRDRACKAEAEVERLHADQWGEGFNAGCDAANAALAESVEHYKAENAKLRELVRDMFGVISRNNTWWDGNAKDTSRLSDRMRELGIEVD